MIEMQQAVDEGLDCVERIAGEMGGYCREARKRVKSSCKVAGG
jgi:hypothetical protein